MRIGIIGLGDISKKAYHPVLADQEDIDYSNAIVVDLKILLLVLLAIYSHDPRIAPTVDILC